MIATKRQTASNDVTSPVSESTLPRVSLGRIDPVKNFGGKPLTGRIAGPYETALALLEQEC